MAECRHPKTKDIWSLSEIRQAYGDKATEQVPVQPGYARLANDAQKPVYLSRLSCKVHFAQISPESIEAVTRTILTGPAPSARQTVEELLAGAYEGRPIDPTDLARAEAATRLEELAAQGERDRAEAAAAKAVQEAREALHGPASEQLMESRETVQELLDAAFHALMNLMDGVDDDRAEHEDVFKVLTAGGHAPHEIRVTDGYVTKTIVGGEQFKMHLKAEYLLTLLHTLWTTRHYNSTVGVGGRSVSKELPPLTQGGPRISPELVNPEAAVKRTD